jgi:hypothetical protein
MTQDEIRQAFLQLLPRRSESVSEVPRGIISPTTRPAEMSQESILPDSGERDIPQGRSRDPLAEELVLLTRGIVGLDRAIQDQTRVAEVQGTAVGSNITETPPVGSALRNAASTFSPALGGPLAVSPILSGLAGLLRGGPKEQPDLPLPYYVAPTSVAVESGLDRSGAIQPVSYGSGGQLRLLHSQPTPTNIPPITIQVQAMDSRSFVDHSHEIAHAVRDAMLRGHGLNDVFAEI